MSEIPDYLTPEILLHNVFAAAEVRKGGVLKRKVRDVERLCGRDLLLAEARRRERKTRCRQRVKQGASTRLCLVLHAGLA